MNRAELEALTLDELYRTAAEHGLREASGLPRDVVIDRVLELAAAAAQGPAATAPPATPPPARSRASTEVQVPSDVAPDRPALTEIEAPPAPRGDEPVGMLDLEEPPDAYGVDECELIAQNPHHVFVYWEVTDHGLAAARADLGDEGASAKLVLRLFATQGPGERGPEREQRDHALDWNHGRRYLPSPRPGARVRAAVGLLTPSGLFAPIAQSSQVRVPPAEPAAHVASDWMEVVPARTRGAEPEPIHLADRGAEAAERGPTGAPPPDSAPVPSTAAPAPEPGDHENERPGSPWRWRPGSQS